VDPGPSSTNPGVSSLEFLPWWRLVGFLLVVAVLLGSLLPTADVPSVPFSDKLQHAGAYALLMYWFASISRQRSHIFAALLLLALGIAIEFLQRATGYRDFEVADMVADGIGVLSGWLIAWTPAGRILPAVDLRLAGWMGRS
jgi:VanZ family protein